MSFGQLVMLQSKATVCSDREIKNLKCITCPYEGTNGRAYTGQVKVTAPSLLHLLTLEEPAHLPHSQAPHL